MKDTGAFAGQATPEKASLGQQEGVRVDEELPSRSRIDNQIRRPRSMERKHSLTHLGGGLSAEFEEGKHPKGEPALEDDERVKESLSFCERTVRCDIGF